MVDEEWWNRLVTAIEAEKAKGRSYRALSKDAGLNANFVTQLKTAHKMPGFDAVLKLCRQLGITVTYLVTGSKVEPWKEEVIQLFERLSQKERDSLIELLRARRRTDKSRE